VRRISRKAASVGVFPWFKGRLRVAASKDRGAP
jgi:hypothetical protein